MTADFKHPLARDAKIWTTAGASGTPQPILVIVTTLQLDPSHGQYKAAKVARLSDAAREWLSANPSAASDFVIVSRPKTWLGDRGQ